MSIIPNNFVNAVVAIGVEQQNGYIEKLWIGTGFLVSMQEPNNIQTSTIYLITNKHVLNDKNQVNLVQLMTYYSLGKWIVEEQQEGEEWEKYGKQVLKTLSESLTKEFGRGFSETNLEYARKIICN